MQHSSSIISSDAQLSYFSRVFTRKKLELTIPEKDLDRFVTYLRNGEYVNLRIDMKYRITVGNKSWVVFGSRLDRDRRILFTHNNNDILILDYLSVHDEYASSVAMDASWFRDFIRNRLFTEKTELLAEALDCHDSSGLNFDRCMRLNRSPVPCWNDRSSLTIQLDPAQIEASAISASLFILMGDPGVGKTVVARTILWQEIERCETSEHTEQKTQLCYMAKSPRLVATEKSLFEQQAVASSLGTQLHYLSEGDLYPAAQTHSLAEIKSWVRDRIDPGQKSTALANKYLSLHNLSSLQVIQELQLLYVLQHIDRDNFASQYIENFARASLFENFAQATQAVLHLFWELQERFFSAKSLPYVEGFSVAQPEGIGRFSLIAVDEVQNWTLPEIWAVFCMSERLVLSGDPKQNQYWQGVDNIGLFETLVKNFVPGSSQNIVRTTLRRHYRCGLAILELANRLLRLRTAILQGVTYKGEPTQIQLPTASDIHFAQVRLYEDLDSPLLTECLRQLPNNSLKWAVLTLPQHVDEAKDFFERRGIQAVILPPDAAPGIEFVGTVLYRGIDRALLNKQNIEHITAATAEDYRLRSARSDNLAKHESVINWSAAYLAGATRGTHFVIVIEPTAKSQIIRKAVEVLFPLSSPVRDHTRSFPVYFGPELSLEENLERVKAVLLNGEIDLARDWFERFLKAPMCPLRFEEWHASILEKHLPISNQAPVHKDSVLHSPPGSPVLPPSSSTSQSPGSAIPSRIGPSSPNSVVISEHQFCREVLRQAMHEPNSLSQNSLKSADLDLLTVYSLFFSKHFLLKSDSLYIAASDEEAALSLFAICTLHRTMTENNTSIADTILQRLLQDRTIRHILSQTDFFNLLVREDFLELLHRNSHNPYVEREIALHQALIWAALSIQEHGLSFLQRILGAYQGKKSSYTRMISLWGIKLRDSISKNSSLTRYPIASYVGFEEFSRFYSLHTGKNLCESTPDSSKRTKNIANSNPQPLCFTPSASKECVSYHTMINEISALLQNPGPKDSNDDNAKAIIMQYRSKAAIENTDMLQYLEQKASILKKKMDALEVAVHFKWHKTVYVILLSLGSRNKCDRLLARGYGPVDLVCQYIDQICGEEKSNQKIFQMIVRQAMSLGFFRFLSIPVMQKQFFRAITTADTAFSISLLEMLKESGDLTILIPIETDRHQLNADTPGFLNSLLLGRHFLVSRWLIENKFCAPEHTIVSPSGTALQLALLHDAPLDLCLMILEKVKEALETDDPGSTERQLYKLFINFKDAHEPALILLIDRITRLDFSDVPPNQIMRLVKGLLHKSYKKIAQQIITPRDKNSGSSYLDSLLAVMIDPKQTFFRKFGEQSNIFEPIMKHLQPLYTTQPTIESGRLAFIILNELYSIAHTIIQYYSIDSITDCTSDLGTPLMAAIRMKQPTLAIAILKRMHKDLPLSFVQKHLAFTIPGHRSASSAILELRDPKLLQYLYELINVETLLVKNELPFYAMTLQMNDSAHCNALIDHCIETNRIDLLSASVDCLPGAEKTPIFSALSSGSQAAFSALLRIPQLSFSISPHSGHSILTAATQEATTTGESEFLEILLSHLEKYDGSMSELLAYLNHNVPDSDHNRPVTALDMLSASNESAELMDFEQRLRLLGAGWPSVDPELLRKILKRSQDHSLSLEWPQDHEIIASLLSYTDTGDSMMTIALKSNLLSVAQVMAEALLLFFDKATVRNYLNHLGDNTAISLVMAKNPLPEQKSILMETLLKAGASWPGVDYSVLQYILSRPAAEITPNTDEKGSFVREHNQDILSLFSNEALLSLLSVSADGDSLLTISLVHNIPSLFESLLGFLEKMRDFFGSKRIENYLDNLDGPAHTHYKPLRLALQGLDPQYGVNSLIQLAKAGANVLALSQEIIRDLSNLLDIASLQNFDDLTCDPLLPSKSIALMLAVPQLLRSLSPESALSLLHSHHMGHTIISIAIRAHTIQHAIRTQILIEIFSLIENHTQSWSIESRQLFFGFAHLPKYAQKSYSELALTQGLCLAVGKMMELGATLPPYNEMLIKKTLWSIRNSCFEKDCLSNTDPFAFSHYIFPKLFSPLSEEQRTSHAKYIFQKNESLLLLAAEMDFENLCLILTGYDADLLYIHPRYNQTILMYALYNNMHALKEKIYEKLQACSVEQICQYLDVRCTHTDSVFDGKSALEICGNPATVARFLELKNSISLAKKVLLLSQGKSDDSSGPHAILRPSEG